MKRKRIEKTHKPLRFSISDIESGRVYAVVEATDARHAQQRFERVRPMVKAMEQQPCDVYSVQEQARDAPVHTALFLDGFFDVLDASDALKH